MSLRLCQHASLGQQSWPEGKSPTGDHKSQAPAKRSQRFNATYRNILWAQHVACLWPPRCEVLRRVFRHVGCCWLKFKRGQFLWNICGYCTRLKSFGQVHAATLHPTGMRTNSIYNTQRVATLRNMVTKCKRAQHVVSNNVAIHYSEKLRSFGRSLQMLGQQCYVNVVLKGQCHGLRMCLKPSRDDITWLCSFWRKRKWNSQS